MALLGGGYFGVVWRRKSDRETVAISASVPALDNELVTLRKLRRQSLAVCARAPYNSTQRDRQLIPLRPAGDLDPDDERFLDRLVSSWPTAGVPDRETLLALMRNTAGKLPPDQAHRRERWQSSHLVDWLTVKLRAKLS